MGHCASRGTACCERTCLLCINDTARASCRRLPGLPCWGRCIDGMPWCCLVAATCLVCSTSLGPSVCSVPASSTAASPLLPVLRCSLLLQAYLPCVRLQQQAHLR